MYRSQIPSLTDVLFEKKQDAYQLFQLYSEMQGYKNPILTDLFQDYLLNNSEKSRELVTDILSHQFYEKLVNPNPFKCPGPKALGEFSWAYLTSKTGGVFGTDEGSLQRGTLILGAPGSGKTTAIYVLANSIYCGGKAHLWFIDFKNDFSHCVNFIASLVILDTNSWRFNPFEPPREYEKNLPNWISIVAAVFGSCAGLMEASQSYAYTILYDLFKTYGCFDGSRLWPTPFNFYEALIAKKVNRYSIEAQYHDRLISRLVTLNTHCEKMFSFSCGFPIEVLERMSIVFDLSKGLLPWIEEYLAVSVVQKVYEHRKESGIRGDNNLTLLLVFDEMARVASENKEKNAQSTPIFSVFCQRIREFQCGLLCASQISSFSQSLKGTTTTKILMRVADYRDLMDFAQSMGLNEEQIAYARNLSVGQAIVKTGNIPDVFPVQFPFIDIDKTKTDYSEEMAPILDELNKFTKPAKSLAEVLRVEVREDKTQNKDNEQKKSILTSDHILFMSKIADCPDFITTTQLYDACGFSSKAKGNRLKKELLQLGYIFEKRIRLKPGKGASPACLFLSERGWILALSRKPEKEKGKGSIVHKKCVRLIARSLILKGYKPLIEHKLGEKFIDIVVENVKEGVLYAIEYESSIHSVNHASVNCIKDLEVTNKVIFVAPTNSILKAIKKQVLSNVPSGEHSRIFFFTLPVFIAGHWVKNNK